MSRRPIQLYRHPLSGHSHRVELMLSLLGLEFDRIDVDLMKGEHTRPEFLARNPFGQVPVLDDDGYLLADSNAILVYLAKRYGAGLWLPEDPSGAADVQRWLSVAAGPLANGPAAARLITVFGASHDPAVAIERAHGLLSQIDAALADRRWLTGEQPTIADVALYTYVAHAPEGNVSLEAYPQVRAWLARIESLRAFVPMQRTPVGLQQAA